jgi:CHRD domain
MNNLHISVLITSIIVTALVTTPISIYAQQQTNYVATLTGKDMVPPVNTSATGVARFHMNPDGSLCYSIDVSHITGVLGAHIGTKNGLNWLT